jgi:ribosomal protein S18 acetylase RimI-like enzyme
VNEHLASKGFFELFEIYVEPEAWGLRIGEALLDSALHSVPVHTLGVNLWILVRNDRARNFYQRQDFELDGSSQVLAIGDRNLEEIRYDRTQPQG